MKQSFVMFAHYNKWANKRLYDAAALLSDEDYRADRGAFFRSVHGTLNHLLTADHIWLFRFTGVGQPPDRLDAIVAEDFSTLRTIREETDTRLTAFCEEVGEDRLSQLIQYRAVTGNVRAEQTLASALFHCFNHQTHHRGQVHAILSGLTGAAPVLDMVAFQREVGAGQARLL